eukprot:TRINITY_DN9292_c0_g1_i1.p1 TRINITY_DN9292_c0_g1~~TRINITY_DN9292_c0_g1_i1.p1  ORF type:complete len:245 (-),score=28.90 TRINITY_DN9292_c0_g1_i1:30-764(-)
MDYTELLPLSVVESQKDREVLALKLNGVVSKLFESMKVDTPQENWWSINGVVVAGVTFVACSAFAYYWHYTREKRKQEELMIENNRLKMLLNKMTQEFKFLQGKSEDFTSKNTDLKNENDELMKRTQNLEYRVLDLLESFSKKEGDKLPLVTKIYREHIDKLTSEIANLMHKNQQLHSKMECSICFSQESNCMLRPCGHTLCSDCYRAIEHNWANSSSYLQNRGPRCPFCRANIDEVCPKYNSL